jgi:hypothetical protein
MDPTQGNTTDYDTAYRAEMDRLEREATAANNGGAATTPPTEQNQDNPGAVVNVEANPPAGAPAANNPATSNQETAEERIARMERELESTKKALNDTKGWASRTAADLKRIQREQAERERLANPPQVLRDNPGLDEAIRFVTGAPAAGQPAAYNPDAWADAVATALPNLDGLLEQNPDLRAKAEAKARELGQSWNDPLVAIRELGALQLEHERSRVSAAAVETARRDFQQRQQKQTAMQVPGAGGAARPNTQPRDDAGRWATMSSADFAKERARVLGLT